MVVRNVWVGEEKEKKGVASFIKRKKKKIEEITKKEIKKKMTVYRQQMEAKKKKWRWWNWRFLLEKHRQKTKKKNGQSSSNTWMNFALRNRCTHNGRDVDEWHVSIEFQLVHSFFFFKSTLWLSLSNVAVHHHYWPIVTVTLTSLSLAGFIVHDMLHRRGLVQQFPKFYGRRRPNRNGWLTYHKDLWQLERHFTFAFAIIQRMNQFQWWVLVLCYWARCVSVNSSTAFSFWKNWDGKTRPTKARGIQNFFCASFVFI